LEPRIDSVSRLTGLRPLSVILTCFKCVFIETSTPATVPLTIVPFLSSMVTVSLESFMRKRTSFMAAREAARSAAADLGSIQ